MDFERTLCSCRKSQKCRSHAHILGHNGQLRGRIRMRPGCIRRSSASLAWPVLSYTAHTLPTALAKNGQLLSTTRIVTFWLTSESRSRARDTWHDKNQEAQSCFARVQYSRQHRQGSQ